MILHYIKSKQLAHRRARPGGGVILHYDPDWQHARWRGKEKNHRSTAVNAAVAWRLFGGSLSAESAVHRGEPGGGDSYPPHPFIRRTLNPLRGRLPIDSSSESSDNYSMSTDIRNPKTREEYGFKPEKPVRL